MGRRWSLETAKEMLAEVRERTARAVAAVESLEREVEGRQGSRRVVAAEVARDRISLWMREMEALGVEVRGPWRVEFGTEEGAFCWAWPDERLSFRAADAEETTPIQ